MKGTLAATIAGGLLILSPSGSWADTPSTTTQHLEHLMIENADTPEEHRALARYYRMKASDAKALAQEHRKMAERYSGGNMGNKRAMKKHCDRIAELNEDLAAQYEELAKGEDAAAAM